jgi:hypothetical protein
MQPIAIASSAVPVILPSAAVGVGSSGTAPFGDLLKNAIAGVDGLEQRWKDFCEEAESMFMML